MQQWLIVGFTGQDIQGDPGRALALIRSGLHRMVTSGKTIAAVSTVTSDSDIMFAHEIDQQEIPRAIVLPAPVAVMPMQVAPDYWQRIDSQLSRAMYVDEANWAESYREGLLEAGILVIDRADVMLVAWDGDTTVDEANNRHRTAELVNYCRALKKPLMLIDLTSGGVSVENWRPIEVGGARSQQESETTNPLSSLAPRQQVERLYKQLDESASQLAPSTRAMMLRLILINLIAAGIAASVMALSFPQEFKMAATLLKILALSLVLLFTRRQRRVQKQWTKARLGAELCRSYLGLWSLKRHCSIELKVSLPECSELLKALSIWWHLGRSDAKGFEAAKNEYLNDRVHQQQTYFAEHSQQASRWHPKLRAAATAATAGAIVSSATVASIVFLNGPESPQSHWLRLTSTLLPLFSAAILSYIVARELPRRSNRYAEMTRILELQATRIQAAPNWPCLWRAVAATEDLLLQELVEWYAKNQDAAKTRKLGV